MRVHEIVSQASGVALAALAAASIAGCCFGGFPRLSPPPTAAPPIGGGIVAPPSTYPTQGITTIAAATAITIAPGFAPDPTLAMGTAGGPTPANTMGAMCRGSIATAPNVTLTTTAALPNVRILVRSEADTTLIVRLSDGRVLCDDDGAGYPNPAVMTALPVGTHQIYVGTYSPTARGAAFTLGITTQPTTTSASLPAPQPGTQPPTVVAGALPRDCGQTAPLFGPLNVGAVVLLGAHTPYTGPNGQGGVVATGTEEELNWTAEMQPFVGTRTTVTSLDGVDGAGCTVVRVAADSQQYYWRVRDMSL